MIKRFGNGNISTKKITVMTVNIGGHYGVVLGHKGHVENEICPDEVKFLFAIVVVFSCGEATQIHWLILFDSRDLHSEVILIGEYKPYCAVWD